MDKNDIFKEKAKNKHGEKYGYDLVDYVNNRTPVTITCPIHGNFKQTPHEHLGGCGCPSCAKQSRSDKRRKALDLFKQQAKEVHGDRYDYSKVDYKNANEKVCIICPEHGEFFMAPSNHIRQKQGCPKCRNIKIGDSLRSNTENFIKKAEALHPNENYDFSKVEYKGNKEKVLITCPVGHNFYIRPNDFLMGHSCPECAKKFGISEEQVASNLEKIFGDITRQYKPEWLHSKTSYQSIDIFLPQYNIGVEYQGAQHFRPSQRFSGENGYKIVYERDVRKYNKCKEHGIKLFYISFERNIPQNYIDNVYTSIQDLVDAINTYINRKNVVKLTENDITTMVHNVLETLFNNYL